MTQRNTGENSKNYFEVYYMYVKNWSFDNLLKKKN